MQNARKLIAMLLATVLAGPASAAELVMIEERGCAWCARWDAEIAPIYPRTSEGARAALRRVDIGEASSSGIEFVGALVFTPTFVLVKDAREVGRIEGYPGEDFFWGMLGQLLDKLPDEPGPHTEDSR